MKYIVLELDGVETIHLFPNREDMTHAHMFEAITSIRVDAMSGPRSWDRKYRDAEVVSAGFVYPSGECYGESITLGVESRPEEDTQLLANSYR